MLRLRLQHAPEPSSGASLFRGNQGNLLFRRFLYRLA